jgi:DMSO/TMAO reductase YedYZ molybdopterin-dependent catalytic subunit
LEMTGESLNAMPALAVRTAEENRRDGFQGVYAYEGIPLREVLRRVNIKKKGKSDFRRDIDLIVRIRGRGGGQAIFSLGEILYSRSPCAGPVLAYRFEAIKPTHMPGYRKNLREKQKLAGLRLVVPGDLYDTRYVEDVAEVVVENPGAKSPRTQKKETMWSDRIAVEGKGIGPTSVGKRDVPRFEKGVRRTVMVGMGRGYHGLRRFSGIPLRSLLGKLPAGALSPRHVFVVHAPDGYRTTLSYGEVFLSRTGESMILACESEGRDLPAGDGRFQLVLPEDFFVDRWVKSVNRLEIMDMGI